MNTALVLNLLLAAVPAPRAAAAEAVITPRPVPTGAAVLSAAALAVLPSLSPSLLPLGPLHLALPTVVAAARSEGEDGTAAPQVRFGFVTLLPGDGTARRRLAGFVPAKTPLERPQGAAGPIGFVASGRYLALPPRFLDRIGFIREEVGRAEWPDGVRVGGFAAQGLAEHQ